jgi:hypothetical protein
VCTVFLNIHKFCIFPTECMFAVIDIKNIAVVSPPNSVNRFVFVMATQCVLCGRNTIFKYYLDVQRIKISRPSFAEVHRTYHLT